ncbi:cytidine deaminase [Cecembia calidifontis]|uniref:Cytidine deaminase n=1 Tax=Cecembia calidifontis TaxID=1187080 RepID=A0A4Q7P4J1_9BACT|nr:cytidine deaminase [Cecembia calidifontis]RZS94794.1 cytidine deaminase [Cecembia calidifontis]
MQEKIEMKVSLTVYPTADWSEEDRVLVGMAKEIMEKAHAPYSDFLVGAALLLENGEKLMANNQENVSFPVGVCAERAVLSYAMANFPMSKPLKIVISAKKRNGNKFATVTPCGLCRQTINEYENKFQAPIQVMMLTPEGNLLVADGIEQLLPFRFNDLNS